MAVAMGERHMVHRVVQKAIIVVPKARRLVRRPAVRDVKKQGADPMARLARRAVPKVIVVIPMGHLLARRRVVREAISAAMATVLSRPVLLRVNGVSGIVPPVLQDVVLALVVPVAVLARRLKTKTLRVRWMIWRRNVGRSPILAVTRVPGEPRVYLGRGRFLASHFGLRCKQLSRR
jgi:hypothetical protein